MTDLLKQLESIYVKLGGKKSDIPPAKLNDLEYIIDKIEDVSGEYSNYDAVIKLSKATVDADNNTATLIKGNFADLQKKALAKQLIEVAVFGAEDNATSPRTTTFFVGNVTYSTGRPGGQASSPEILVSVVQFGGLQESYVARQSGGTVDQKVCTLMDMSRGAVLYIDSNNEVGWKN